MSFGRLLRAEWTKLRSVNRWVLTLAAAGVLTVSFSALVASGGSVDLQSGVAVGPDGRPVADDFHFVHRTLTGDGTVVARVVDQADSHPGAAAGLIVKDGVTRGSTYAAVAVTPGAGVRMTADFADVRSRAGTAPRWLRLTRAGTRVTGYDSVDGTRWRELGSVRLPGLPSTAQVGMYLTSPADRTLERSAGRTSVGMRSTTGRATFADVRVDGTASAAWVSDDLARPLPPDDPSAGREPPPTSDKKPPEVGGTTQDGNRFTLTGSGDIGLNEPPDDTVQIGLFGAFAGLLALIPIGVLFITSEYRRGMIRTTFAATPARVPVLLAKAVVVGVVTFGIGLVAALVSFFLSQPLLREHGFKPPMFPEQSLTEPRVLRAVVGSAVFLALLSVIALGAGAVLRRSAPAVAAVVALTLVPMFVGSVFPVAAARWLMRLTPAGGLAMQRAKPPTDTLVEPWSMIGPGAGLAVMCAYAVLTLGLGAWLMRRRDA